MIRLFVMLLNPFFTRRNTSRIAKEFGIQEAFNYGVIIFGKRTKRLLRSRVKIVDPGFKQLNTYKLVVPVDNPWIRLVACTVAVGLQELLVGHGCPLIFS